MSDPFTADLFRSERVAIGTFRCAAQHPSFRNTGPIRQSIVVFPRTAVWIRHEGSRRFLADPTVVTIYNRGQRYERFTESRDGDRCDWFAVSDDLAREIAVALDEAAADRELPFRFQWSPSSTRLYLRQRHLLRRAREGSVDVLEGEEEVVTIVAEVLRLAAGGLATTRARRHGARRRHRELADAARCELLRGLHANGSVHDIAARVGTSPFHLCRVFRAETGRTMHEYRTELRVRVALERLEHATDRHGTLATIACDLGFASHSHFVRAMRRHAGHTPSAVRSMLGTPKSIT